MRIKITLAFIAIAGIVLASILLVSNQTSSSAGIEKVLTVCSQCHGSVPRYESMIQVHAIHVAKDCNLCHTELKNVTATCTAIQCHGSIPQHDSALQIHERHALECSSCHIDSSSLKVAGSIHNDFKWVGLGLLFFVVGGVLVNYFLSAK